MTNVFDAAVAGKRPIDLTDDEDEDQDEDQSNDMDTDVLAGNSDDETSWQFHVRVCPAINSPVLLLTVAVWFR